MTTIHQTAQPSQEDHGFIQSKGGADIRSIGLALYITTLLFELPGALARYAILVFLFWFAGIFNRLVVAVLTLIQSFQQAASFGSSGTPSGPINPTLIVGGGILGFFNYLLTVATAIAPIVIFLVTIAPIAFSLATFFLPGGFFLRRFALGARIPSFRERQLVDSAIATITAAANQPISAPPVYYVLDKPSLEAQVIGTTLYLSRGLINDPQLAAVLGHEFAHVASWDGRLVLALRRLVLFPVYLLSRTFGQVAPGVVHVSSVAGSELGCLAGAFVWIFGLLLSLSGGGFGLWLLNLPWGWYWKQREYAADRYAAEVGQQGNFIQYLSHPQVEQQATFDIATPYLILAPPSSELRRDRLEHPENYIGADRIDVRPYLIAAAALLVVVCGLPIFTSAATRALHSVDNTSWTLARFCRSKGCEPAMDASIFDSRIQLVFRQPDDVRGVEIDVFNPNNTVGQALATYHYVDDRRILINMTDNGFGVPVMLGGIWEISKSGEELILTGDYETYVFRRT